MALSREAKLQIALKKLVGRATTKTKSDEGLANETLPTNIQVAASTVFAEVIPDTAYRSGQDGGIGPLGGTAGYGTNPGSITDAEGNELNANYERGVVECIRFDLVPIAASSYDASQTPTIQPDNTATAMLLDQAGIHAYAAAFPAGYTGASNNFLADEIGWRDGDFIYEAQGKVQAVPPIYGSDVHNIYGPTGPEYKLYGAVPLVDVQGGGVDVIGRGDGREWYFDYYSGIFFQERAVKDSTGTVTFETPKYIDVLVYIGDYVSDRIGFNSDGLPGIVDTPGTSGYVWKATSGGGASWLPDDSMNALDDLNCGTTGAVAQFDGQNWSCALPLNSAGTTGFVDDPTGQTVGYVWKVLAGGMAGWSPDDFSPDTDTWIANALGVSGYVAAPPSATGHYWGTTGIGASAGTPQWLPIPEEPPFMESGRDYDWWEAGDPDGLGFNNLVTTSSVAIGTGATAERATFFGDDTFLYVGGTVGTRADYMMGSGAGPGIAHFAGDLLTSGNFHAGCVDLRDPVHIGTPGGDLIYPYPGATGIKNGYVRGYLNQDPHYGHVLSGSFIDIGIEPYSSNSYVNGGPVAIRQIEDLQTQVVFDTFALRLIASDAQFGPANNPGGSAIAGEYYGAQIDVFKGHTVDQLVNIGAKIGQIRKGGNVNIKAGDVNPSAPLSGGLPLSSPDGDGGSIRIFAGNCGLNTLANARGGEVFIRAGSAGMGNPFDPTISQCAALGHASGIRLYAGHAFEAGQIAPTEGGNIEIIAGGGWVPGDVFIAGGVGQDSDSNWPCHPDYAPGSAESQAVGDVYLDGGCTLDEAQPLLPRLSGLNSQNFGGRVLINTVVNTILGPGDELETKDESDSWGIQNPGNNVFRIDSHRARACGIGEPEPLATLHITDNAAAVAAGLDPGYNTSPLELTRLRTMADAVYPLVVAYDPRPCAPPDSWLVYRYPWTMDSLPGQLTGGGGGQRISNPKFGAGTITAVPNDAWDDQSAKYRMDTWNGPLPYPDGGTSGHGPSGASAAVWFDNTIAVDTHGASAFAGNNGGVITIELESGVDNISGHTALDSNGEVVVLHTEAKVEGREIVIKDIGNNAGNVNIKIVAKPGEKIDGSLNVVQLDADLQFIKLKATGPSGAAQTTPGWTIVG